MINTHKYTKYEDYVNFQLEKTSNKEKQKKWLGTEWKLKINIFKKYFKANMDLIKNKKKAICLGSRTGQEVVALKELGISDTIGIDLHEFPPYTIKGDIHDINFDDNTFDLAFSNIFDHSLYPDKFAKEIFRILKTNGIFILHYNIGDKLDKYTEVYINSDLALKSLFNKFNIIKEQNINSTIMGLNKEIIFKKVQK